jgi:NADH-quinone oxidoreductase subunit H
MIYLFSFFTSTIYFISFLILIILWIWVRATLPRHRYDLLIGINWKVLLPLSITSPCLTILTFYIYNKILLFNSSYLNYV